MFILYKRLLNYITSNTFPIVNNIIRSFRRRSSVIDTNTAIFNPVVRQNARTVVSAVVII